MQLPKHIENPDWRIYESENWVVFDFETTNRDKGSALDQGNRLLLATWIWGRSVPNGLGKDGQEQSSETVQTCSGELVELQRLFAALEAADFVVAHNAKFELQWLDRLGFDISRLVVYDTMLGEYVRLGNRQGAKDLDTVLRRYGIPCKRGLVSTLIKGGVCPSDIDERWLVDYGTWDTEATHLCFLQQREELSKLGLLPVLYTRCLVTPVLADIEKYGVTPDPRKVAAEIEKVSRQHAEASRELQQITKGINLRSSKQVSEFLYDALKFQEPSGRDGRPDRTDGGGRKTDAESIAKLKVSTEAQREFKDIYGRFRPLDKRLEILTKLQAAINDGGILYAQYNQAVTKNHRLSSSGRKHKLQFQNFPRDYKRLFGARHKGWLVGEGDGRQLEFRAAAHLCRDSVAGRDIRDDFDVHRFTAVNLNDELYKVYEAEGEGALHSLFARVSKGLRQDSKPETFRPLYGSKGNSPNTKRYAKAFSKRWRGIADTQRAWTHSVLKDKQLRIESGLIFYWPSVSISDYGYVKHTTEIYNYPVSSFATADIIPIGLVYAWHRLRACKARTFINNTVHDSINAEVHPEEVKLFSDILKESMTNDTLRYLSLVYVVDYTVPLGVEIKVGTHWGDGSANDEIFEVDPLKAAA